MGAWPRRRFAWLAALLVLGAGLLVIRSRLPRRLPVAHARRGDVVQTVVASGRVLMAADVELAAKNTGRVVELRVREGERVEAGALLLRLDETDAAAALAEARASLARSLVELRRLRQKATPLAQASLRRAEVDVDYAEQELARSQQLFQAGAQTAQQVQQARQALELAHTRRETAHVELASTLPAGGDRDLAVASMRQAEAALEVARTRVDDCRVLAPVAGTIAELGVDAGDSVAVGRVLVRIVGEGPVQLEMEPDERNLALLAVGQPARASAEAFATQSFAARVRYIAPKVDPDRGTIKVRLDVPDAPDYLRGDMTVSIEVEVRRVRGALALPVRVVRDLAAETPWVLVLANGRTERRAIEVGVRGEEVIEARRGLTEQDAIVDAPDVGEGVRAQPAAPGS